MTDQTGQTPKMLAALIEAALINSRLRTTNADLLAALETALDAIDNLWASKTARGEIWNNETINSTSAARVIGRAAIARAKGE